jgi:hypothetical protein
MNVLKLNKISIEIYLEQLNKSILCDKKWNVIKILNYNIINDLKLFYKYYKILITN